MFRLKQMLCVMVCLTFVSMAGAYIEDFSGDPAANGWTNFPDPARNQVFLFQGSTEDYVFGQNIYRENYDAYYVNLDQAKTQNDDFSIQFDYSCFQASAWTYQYGYVGFFDQSSWVDSATAGDALALRLNGRSTSTNYACFVDSGTINDGSFFTDSATSFATMTWRTLVLDYTAGAGDNNAGLLTIDVYPQADMTTPDYTLTYSLEAGATFSVDSFGMVTGGTGSPAGGLNMFMDNVDMSAIPEPMTLALLGLGGFSAFHCRRK